MVRNENYTTAKADLKEHPRIKGEKGLFAIEPINKGEIVVIFGGLVVSIDQIKDQIKNDGGDYLFQISEDHFLELVNKDEKLDKAEYVNHSCSPNCGIRGQIVLEAMRDIKPGEELTYDYATTDTKLGSLKCECRCENCRKIINPDDWKIKELQERYKGYFSYYIGKKISELKN